MLLTNDLPSLKVTLTMGLVPLSGIEYALFPPSACCIFRQMTVKRFEMAKTASIGSILMWHDTDADAEFEFPCYIITGLHRVAVLLVLLLCIFRRTRVWDH